MLVGFKLIFDRPSITDGKRVFVERLWPRGVKRSTANIDLWMKDIAPSDELRQWFIFNQGKWAEFKKRYIKELASNKHLIELAAMIKSTDITLLYSSKNQEHSSVIILEDMLKKVLK